MKALIILASVLLLTACSTTRDVVKIETVEVKVPVLLPCPVQVPERPDYITHTVPEDASIFEKMVALLSDRKLSMAHEEELTTLLRTCTTPLN